MRRDLFPSRMCDELEPLTDSAEPHSWADTCAALDRELGAGWREWLALDPAKPPIGSGSIAQVYKGRLMRRAGGKGKGRGGSVEPVDVAVKVLHPGVARDVDSDMRVLRCAAWALDRAVPSLGWLDLPCVVGEFGRLMKSNLDLAAEARNLRRFRRNFRSDPSVHFPEPFSECASRGVLVEELSGGVPVALVAAEASEAVKRRVADVLCESLLQMLFVDNLAHGDLHSGNVLVTGLDPATLAPASGARAVGVTLVDVGMVTELSTSDWNYCIDVLEAIVKRDGRLIGRMLLDRARRSECKDRNAFVDGVAGVVNAALATGGLSSDGAGLNLGKLRVGELLGDVLRLAREHHVRLESDFTSVAVTIMVVDALARSLNPQQEVQLGAAPTARSSRGFLTMHR